MKVIIFYDDVEMQIPSPKNEGVTNPHFPKLFLKRVAINEIDDQKKENIGISGLLENLELLLNTIQLIQKRRCLCWCTICRNFIRN